jgi:hypothetical protein
MRTLGRERQIYATVAAMVAALVTAAVVLLVSPVSGAKAQTLEIQTCQDNDSVCASYSTGAWNTVNSSKASGGTYHVSSSTTRPAVFRPAAGPELNLVTATGPKRGTAKVVVYNLCTRQVVKVVRFDLRTDVAQFKVVKRITGLRQDQMYAMAVYSANGMPIVVDAYRGFPMDNVDHSTHHPPTVV